MANPATIIAPATPPLVIPAKAGTQQAVRAAMLPIFLLLLAACSAPAPATAQRTYAASIPPVAAILREVVGERASVTVLIQPGASPHTYEPRPSEAAAAESALALVYVAPDMDGWAVRLQSRKQIALAPLVPEPMRLPWEEHAHDNGHAHAAFNTHFWSDPILVQAMLPALVDQLSQTDPEGAPTYQQNAAKFSVDLTQLDTELQTLLAPIRGKSIALFHPSWNYFLQRYGIQLAGLIEPMPGKEATSQYLRDLIDTLKASGVQAIFSEPQLPKRPAEMVAEAGGWPLHELDPYGGTPNRTTYRELLLHNATVLLEALQ